MNGRWQLHRAGLLNFWLYDEQVFLSEGGRILFRGANGAGKSVTMQSFLPLVLDGDTRPSRLDPFGSRDRKVEYYLLGDESMPKERQSTDRTGYLWLEFYHTDHGRYATIGIGLRARRGNHQIDFWGFVLEDGRRIGFDDFHLYRMNYAQGDESKIPLNWKELRDLIGAGGHVTKDRKEYRRFVNKLLFKFENEKHYQEMLKLLIELRSPKLSKEFKPSTIYDILNNGLPPLTEEELRPLAEVLESIDQLGDRKHELENYVQLVGKLSEAYDRYNEAQLCMRSEAVDRAGLQLEEKAQGIDNIQAELDVAVERLKTLEHREQQVKQTLRTDHEEIKALEDDEAFKKEFELKAAQEKRDMTTRQIDQINIRLRNWRNRLQQAELHKQQAGEQSVELERKREAYLNDLAQTADEMEFTYHNAVHLQFQQQASQAAWSEGLWNSWKKGLDEHGRKLKEALTCAREHGRMQQNVKERELDLGRALEDRDYAESALQTTADQFDQAKQEFQKSLFQWRKQLKILNLEDSEMTHVFHLLHQFPQNTYEEIKQPVQERYDYQLDAIRQERSAVESERREVMEQRQEKQNEWNEWKQQKEPEPPRSEARERTRLQYKQQNRVGMPFYEACEFLPHVSNELRAVLEGILQETGILDAWIGEQGLKGELGTDEYWIVPDPIDFGYTLANYLRPTPSVDGGVTSEEIDRILRSITIGDPDALSERVVLSENGRFRMGTLSGQVAPKVRAEYIGKESRKQTRLRRMAVLETEIQALTSQLAVLDEKTTESRKQEQLLQQEVKGFPEGNPLFNARDAVRQAEHQFQLALGEVSKQNERFKQAAEKERALRGRLIELTREWHSLKNEARLEAAMDQISAYRGDLFELQNTWHQYVNVRNKFLQEQDKAEEAEEQLRVEQEHLETEQGHLAEFEATISAFAKVLQELGVTDKHKRLTDLRHSVRKLGQELEQIGKSLSDTKAEKIASEKALQTELDKKSELASALHLKIVEWRREWELGLCPPWRDVQSGGGISEQLKLCRRVLKDARGFDVKKTDAFYNAVMKLYYEVHPHLHEYALEMIENEWSRLVLQFSADRMNPITPEKQLILLRDQLQQQALLLQDKERELIEKVLIQNVGVNIRLKIQRAELWVKQMNTLMQQRETSSGLQLRLHWEAKPKHSEVEMDTSELVKLLKTDYAHWDETTRDRVNEHFRTRISHAKEMADHQGALRKLIHEFLDYREWYEFKLDYRKGEGAYRELTDSRFNVLSGGEKAMSMYIPLFCAVISRYNGSAPDSPKLVSLDEAFAGVDDANVRDMFQLLTQMGFDYMMTSQVLWGCYDTVPGLAIYEIVRPKDAIDVDAIPYLWNGKVRTANFAALDEFQAG